MSTVDGLSGEARTTISRGHRISYEDVGTGPTVVLVPGILQSAARWRAAGYVDRLAVSYRVIAMDPLGHGQSDKPYEWDAYRMPDVAADIIAVMDAAEVDRAALWGYSRGAALVGMAAIEFPDRVESLIVGGAWLGGRAATGGYGSDGWIEPLSTGDWAGFWAGFGVPVPEAARRLLEATNDPRATSAVLAGASASKSSYAIDVSKISVPTLLYGGSDDPFAEGMAMDAAELGVQPHVLEGREHVGAFLAVDEVVPLAIAHLELPVT